MKRVVWLTDIHMNFLQAQQRAKFWSQVAKEGPDAVLVGGDIGEAFNFTDYLLELAQRVTCPVYFVLGNHDFYHGSFPRVRERAAAVAAKVPNLCWLTKAGVVGLTEKTGLIGHEGWADGRLGNYAASTVMLNDYALIEELSGLTKDHRLQILQQLGDESAAYVGRVLPEALERFERVILLLHVPPFREACWHEGAVSNDEWLPHMGCKAVGEVIMECMRKHRNRRLSVLCGHTHSPGEIRPLRNVRVLTGGAIYGTPAVADVLRVE